MSSKARTNDASEDAASDDVHAKQCTLLALIGFAAILAAVILVPKLDTSEQTSEIASPHSAAAAQTTAETEKPFDYFPAQFPTPQGEVEEPPATF